MKVTVRSFTGMRPVVAPDLLRPGEAVTAINTLLNGGDLAPFNLPLQVIALSSADEIKTIYRYSQNSTSETQHWFQSTNIAHFIKGPIDGDTEEKTYFTGHLTYPSKTKSNGATTSPPYPTTSYAMGIHQPTTALTATVTGTATDPDSAAETVVYVTTFVTSWGEEGPPSVPSTPVSWRAGQSIVITNIPITGTPSYSGNASKGLPNVISKRLYRSATGSSGAARYLLVNTTADIPLATTTYDDTTLTANLGESMRSRYWVEPPDGMKGLTQMANGILAGYVDTTVCFSEPFVPYAWPLRYEQSVDAPVIGMAAFDQSLLVATTRSMYVFTGVDPQAITSERLAMSQTCASTRGMVEMMGGVVFPTPDGLMFVGSSGGRMLTDGLMSRREWQTYVPSSMHAYESDNRYICFYDNGTKGGLIFTFGDEPSFCQTNMYATAGYRDRGRDALYLCFDGGGTVRNVQKWDAGIPSSMTWLSGIFKLPAPINLGIARVDADGTTNFELLADGVVVHGPISVPLYSQFRLPSGYMSSKYQVRITGSAIVRAVEVADCVGSLEGE